MKSQQEVSPEVKKSADPPREFYRVRFRRDGQEFTAAAPIANLNRDERVMIKTDHGLEPALVFGPAPANPAPESARNVSYEIARRPTPDEESRYDNLPGHETSAFETCIRLIEKHTLVMRLIRVEKYFNGSKMIFFFTADSRVDFRALVKDLVQEFRTRVEMRQVGVRHETKMIGGVGICGRELCCSSFMKKFDSVSIKMAKEQDLPLNPTKISGVCNRLLCCLTYEYDTYRQQRKGMPKVGRKIRIQNEIYRVRRQNPLKQSLVVGNSDNEEKVLQKNEWSAGELIHGEKHPKKQGKKASAGPGTHNPAKES